MINSFAKEIRFYYLLMVFRLREPMTDFKATGITYLLYCFFIWLLSNVWLKYNSQHSQFNYSQVFLYIGVTEMLFMSFLSLRAITAGSEDFALFLARPRSWVARELAANIGSSLGKRVLFALSLVVFSMLVQVHIENLTDFVLRILLLFLVMAIPQALIATLFSSLRLSYPQTGYFILPFSKLFLSLGGVFGPLSDYGEPWRTVFLKMPGSDLFFQPAFFAVHGYFYETTGLMWFLRISVICTVVFALVLYFYSKGRKEYQAWGG